MILAAYDLVELTTSSRTGLSEYFLGVKLRTICFHNSSFFSYLFF